MTQNLVIISDTHCGCQLGLCPPDGVMLDEGGTYKPSKFQQGMWEWWEEMCDWLGRTIHKEEFDLALNGDALDGVHHRATTQISHNIKDQRKIAMQVLTPLREKCQKYYHLRGTEAHVGPSGEYEEELARNLQAEPNEIEQYARYELWKTVGKKNQALVHLTHHIGTTGSQAYESTAVLKELVEAYVEAGRWNNQPPDCIVRSHRHRAIQIELPTANTRGISVVTPGWQGKTPFVWKIPGGRQSQPQFGCVLIREAPDGVWYSTPWVKSLQRAGVEE